MKHFAVRIFLLLAVFAAMAGCASQDVSPAAWLPETIDSVDVTYSHGTDTREWTLTETDHDVLRTWLEGLELQPESFDAGSSPADAEGDAAWTFSLNGGEVSFFYLESGHLFCEDTWYAVGNSSVPWSVLPEVVSSTLPQPSTEGVIMTVTDLRDGVLTVQLDNQSGADYDYDGYYSLLREEDGVLREISAQEQIAVEDVLYTVADQAQATVTCDLNCFGPLASGRYRLLKGDLSADFVLTSEGMLDRVTLTVLEVADGTATVLLSNPGPEDAEYGWSCVLEQQDVSGRWSELPLTGDPVGVCGVKDPLNAGEETELQLDVSQYGDLSPGHYRLRMDMDGRAAEFTIA